MSRTIVLRTQAIDDPEATKANTVSPSINTVKHIWVEARRHINPDHKTMRHTDREISGAEAGDKVGLLAPTVSTQRAADACIVS